jgi:hypothetical protein
METFSLVNREVTVNSFYFTQNQNFKSFPRRIELDGTFITFIESGLRLLVKSGQRLAELFDMSDGVKTYRLKLENEHWTLVGVKGGNL